MNNLYPRGTIPGITSTMKINQADDGHKVFWLAFEIRCRLAEHTIEVRDPKAGYLKGVWIVGGN